MGKKKRFDVRGKSKKRSTREDDAVSRVQYLWRAAHEVAPASPALSRFYVSTIREISRRVTVRLDPDSIKRRFCKRCSALLVAGLPGVTWRMSRSKHVVATCGGCGTVRRFGTRRERHAEQQKQTHNTEKRNE